jgi:NitT/TauT family transport system ATP-binding protein
MESVIDIRGLDLTFVKNGTTTPVLKNLDLDIRHGELVAIVGASGVGKSTVLRVLMGLVAPSSGRVSIASTHAGEQDLAMVFQDARLLPWRRVVDNVAFGLEDGDLSKSERRAKALDALDLVGLSALAARWPHELSGGQKQRVALARALAVDPDVLLLDEPFSALDAITRESLQDELLRIRDVTRKTMLFVTHDLDEAVYLADRIVVLAGSPGRKIVDRANPQDTPRRRNAPDQARLVSDLRAAISSGAAERRAAA